MVIRFHDIVRLTLIAALVTALASCALSNEAGSTVDPRQTIGPPAWAVEQVSKPIEVLPENAPATNTSLPWRFLSASADGRQVTLVYSAGDGDCTHFEGFTVQETSTTVTLAARGHTDTSKQACADSAVNGAGVLTLAHPLGTRQLVHAPVTHDWSNWNA